MTKDLEDLEDLDELSEGLPSDQSSKCPNCGCANNEGRKTSAELLEAVADACESKDVVHARRIREGAQILRSMLK